MAFSGNLRSAKRTGDKRACARNCFPSHLHLLLINHRNNPSSSESASASASALSHYHPHIQLSVSPTPCRARVGRAGAIFRFNFNRLHRARLGDLFVRIQGMHSPHLILRCSFPPVASHSLVYQLPQCGLGLQKHKLRCGRRTPGLCDLMSGFILFLYCRIISLGFPQWWHR